MGCTQIQLDVSAPKRLAGNTAEALPVYAIKIWQRSKPQFFLWLFRVCPRVLGGVSAAYNSEAGGSVTEEEKWAKFQHFETETY